MDPRPHTHAPADWHHAFAALPLESPPGDGWQRLATSLPTPARGRPHPPLWLAAAAVTCLAAAPAWLLLRPAAVPLVSPVAGTPATATALPDTSAPTAPREVATTNTVPSAGDVADIASPPAARTHRAPPRAGAGDAEIARLHAESARLEALLAELSQAAGGDAVQLTLASELHARVEAIDADLSTGVRDPGIREGLWQQRVDALRQLATLAADQRWDALYGERDSGYALVQVY
ncbi:hypothetical protein CSC62_04170 [Pseudoxanthomonas jiangsuensis]|uniref:hypothetical protein n=1 Tax=Pseudoxanthomonas jiangsuensis TaxID=619688 RepID=UPI0013908847|nr:hypothetical protein [Pseudoxanthomonas jiangsuensis]KAF1698749.1 hypothetical protein CSC62_04170 [Pseudoxanthomonas jiangsuensis]